MYTEITFTNRTPYYYGIAGKDSLVSTKEGVVLLVKLSVLRNNCSICRVTIPLINKQRYSNVENKTELWYNVFNNISDESLFDCNMLVLEDINRNIAKDILSGLGKKKRSCIFDMKYTGNRNYVIWKK